MLLIENSDLGLDYEWPAGQCLYFMGYALVHSCIGVVGSCPCEIGVGYGARSYYNTTLLRGRKWLKIILSNFYNIKIPLFKNVLLTHARPSFLIIDCTFFRSVFSVKTRSTQGKIIIAVINSKCFQHALKQKLKHSSDSRPQ